MWVLLSESDNVRLHRMLLLLLLPLPLPLSHSGRVENGAAVGAAWHRHQRPRFWLVHITRIHTNDLVVSREEKRKKPRVIPNTLT